ncbi:MAG: hypothetical protein GOU97_00025 [Nanoarchaeota archaeon]|nr:hypothetical protein [Nanoarchaeota archaeon]
MERAVFYLNNIHLDTSESKIPTLKLFGKTEDGKKVCAITSKVKDYLWVVTNANIKELENYELETHEGLCTVEKVVIKEKMLDGQKVMAAQVWVNNPKLTGYLGSVLRKTEKFSQVYEDDIPFIQKYIIDHDLKSFSKVAVTGNKIPRTGFKVDELIQMREIENANGETAKPVVLAFDIETYNPRKEVFVRGNEIIMISFKSSKGFSKVITWKKFEGGENVEFVEDEKALIQKFFKTLKEIGPDVLVGFNSDAFDIPSIMDRAKKFGVKQVAGLDGTGFKVVRSSSGPAIWINGITHIDLYPFFSRTMADRLKTDIMSLNRISKEVLNQSKKSLDYEKINELWASDNPKDICEYCLTDAELTLKLFEKIFPVMMEFSKTVQQQVFKTCRATYGNLVEDYLLKENPNFNELRKRKPSKEEFIKRRKTSFKGGYVHEPKPGLYQNLAVFDFKSLYPSIIISHNISPSSLMKGKKEDGHAVPEEDYWFAKKPVGMIPKILEELVNRRIGIKRIMKDVDVKSSQHAILDARQYSLKIIANSFYGYLGFPKSRWYSIKCAKAVTSFGRDYIKKIIEQSKKAGFEVVYADTDSVFIYKKKSVFRSARKTYEKFLKQINESLHGFMKMDFEGLYKKGLFISKKSDLVGAKKKYALLDEHGNLVIKGFEYVRRDWSPLAKKIQLKVLKKVLAENASKNAVKLVKNELKKLRLGKTPLKELIISVQLKKKLENYSSIGPHVAAAMKAEKKGYFINPGMLVQFIIIKGEGSVSEKAFIYEQVKKEDLKYDPEYYVYKQVLPSVKRILDALNVKEEKYLSSQSKEDLTSFIK